MAQQPTLTKRFNAVARRVTNAQTARPGNGKNDGAALNLADVAREAYYLFEKRGRVHGHHVEDWLKAEAIVRKRNQQSRA